jgi:hypothetical protein
MPTFPRSPFHFVRRVFPSTAGRLAFQAVPSWIIKPAPGMRRPTSSLHPPFVHLVVSTVVPLCAGSPTRLRTAVEGHYSSAQGAGQKRKCPGSRGTSVLPSGADMSACPGMSVWCQGTKSLRSSPLRGSKSRETGSRSREDSDSLVAWSQHDQQAYCWRATHDQAQQEDLRTITLIRRATTTVR